MLRLQNQSETTVTEVDVEYTIRYFNDQERANSVNFSFSEDNSTFTDIPALNFTTPETADSNPAWQSQKQTTTISNLNIAPDEFFYLKWMGDDVSGGGSRDEYGIDDVFVSNLVAPEEDNGGTDPQDAAIYEIQGEGSRSPLEGRVVTTTGVVTADFRSLNADNSFAPLRGIFIQDIEGDNNPLTSDGLFVFLPAPNDFADISLTIGDQLSVTGIVTEDSTGNSTSDGRTEFTHLDFITDLEIIETNFGSIAPTDVFLPETSNGELEQYEGMLVNIASQMTVTQNFFLGRYGQMTLSSPDDQGNAGRLFQPTNLFRPGLLEEPEKIEALADENQRRLLILDDGQDSRKSGDNPETVPFLGAPPPDVIRAGDKVENLVGVLDYGRINSSSSNPNLDYRLQVLDVEAPTFISQNPRQDAPDDVGGRLKVASFNVQNYFTTLRRDNSSARGAFDELEFERQRTKIFAALEQIDADIVGLIEIENNGFGADSAIQNLVDGLNARLGAEVYSFINSPSPSEDDGRLGTDAITNVFIYKSATVNPVGDFAILDKTVDPRFDSDNQRPALAVTFEEISSGETVTVVNNHFKSKGSPPRNLPPGEEPDPRDQDLGDGQGFSNFTRTLAAQALIDWLATDPTNSGDDDILITGDLNAYALEDPIITIQQGADQTADTDDDYTNLINQFVGEEAYSFVFDGQAGYLDHALGSKTLTEQVTGVAEWQINADEPKVIDYENFFNPSGYYSPDPLRASDHDPVIVGLDLKEANVESPPIRVATFNVALNRSSQGKLEEDLSTGEQQQPKNVAEIIQRIAPDILLLNEFDYNPLNPVVAPQLFLDNYLEVEQHPGVDPITYEYVYVAPSNTGEASGFDLDRNGEIVTTPGAPDYGKDAWGFGNFEGQFAMALYSKYEILWSEIRTFKNFRWKDMPGARLPDDPNTPEPSDWYSDEILEEFRLSSKSHWDIPILVDGEVIHILASHPTPPVFDGPEDRNGLRNSDEIRFWADYVTPGQGDYIYDDSEFLAAGYTKPDNPKGGLASGKKFLILGDQNADRFDGDSTAPAIAQLLDNPNIQGSSTDASITPFSAGGVAATIRQGGANLDHVGNPSYDTADFNPNNPGNLRVDYVLPSLDLEIKHKGIFWLTETDPDFERLIGDFNPDLDQEQFPEGFLSSDHRLVYLDVTPKSIDPTSTQPFTLQILHASDQEAGVPAFQDIPGLSAVMNALEDDYENTLKLTSGDVYIAGPFFDGSRQIYDLPNDDGELEPANQPGIADILIQNELEWDVASVGNHEFDAGDGTFFNLLAPNSDLVNGANGGQGMGDEGYLGALFPYLANNLDYSNADLPDGLTVVENGGAPLPNTLTGSVVVDVNGESVGILGAVTPYLESIANTGKVEVTTDDPDGNPITATTPINIQVDSLIANLAPEIERLSNEGIDKLILMTHLQESAIERALAQALAEQGLGIDVLIGGGSHQVMANGDGVPPLREDETQQTNGQLLQPYPQAFSDGGNTVYYVNTGANYRYLSQLVVTFDENGVITEIGDDSGTYATDIAGVNRLYDQEITTIEEVKAVADPDVVAIVDGVETYVNSLDGNIFGQTEFFLNGTRGDVRTQETNLGNIAADAQDYYAEAYLAEQDILPGFERIDISFKNGGGIRDNIGVAFVPGGGGEVVQLPPQSNPAVGKEEGDVSELDISNSLRFNNDLVLGTVTAFNLLELAEHMVSGVEITSGRFGQIGGFKFSYDPNGQARDANNPGERIVNLALTDDEGNAIEAIVENGELVIDPNRTFSVVTLGFLAQGGDSYPEVIENQVALTDLPEPDSLGQADLVIDLGSGDDYLFAGTNNHIIAGSGDDTLFVGSAGGKNVITGGSGMDQFWIVTDSVDLPAEANSITDFTIGEDVIGFGATDLSFNDLDLMQDGSNTIVNGLNQDLAILRNTQASALSESDFVFA